MRCLMTALVLGLLLCLTANTNADDTRIQDQTLAQMGLTGMTQVSDTEGDSIRGTSLVPTISLEIERLVLVDLSLAQSTTVFVQNDLALDLSVLVANRLNLQIGNAGN